LHNPADEIVLHLDQKVQVVWHQAIGVEIEGKFGFLLLEQAGELEVIIVGPEDLSTIISARDDVVEPSSDFDPRFPGHDGADVIVGIVQMSTMSSLIIIQKEQ
jgi:hypothetical protein